MPAITKGETYNITVPGNSGMEAHRAHVIDITRKGRGWTVLYHTDYQHESRRLSMRAFEKALTAV